MEEFSKSQTTKGGMMSLCNQCIGLGYCRKLNAHLVSDAELANPEFIRDVRTAADELCITRDQWRDHLSNLYRDYRGRILDREGNEVFLDMEVFEKASPYWFRDFCITPRPGVRPRVRQAARERVRVMATILRAVFPDAAQFWGVCPANDNEPKEK
jgi:hypothetical protein